MYRLVFWWKVFIQICKENVKTSTITNLGIGWEQCSYTGEIPLDSLLQGGMYLQLVLKSWLTAETYFIWSALFHTNRERFPFSKGNWNSNINVATVKSLLTTSLDVQWNRGNTRRCVYDSRCNKHLTWHSLSKRRFASFQEGNQQHPWIHIDILSIRANAYSNIKMLML